MIEKEKKWKKETIYNLVFAIYFICCLSSITMFDKIIFIQKATKLGRYFSYALFSLLGIYFMISWKEVKNLKDIFGQVFGYIEKHILLCLLACVTFLVFCFSGYTMPFLLLILMWSLSFTDLKQVLNVVLWGGIFFMMACFFAQSFGIIEDVTFLRSDGTWRYSFGYIYPLETAAHVLTLIILYYYLYYQNCNLKIYLVCNFINLLVYKITDARMTFILILAFTTLMSLLKLQFVKHKFLILVKYKIIYGMFFVAVILPIIISVFYNPQNVFLHRFDQILNGRFELAKRAFDFYGFNFWGQKITWVGSGTNSVGEITAEQYNFVDCSYMKNIFDYGLIFFVIVIIGFFLLLKKFCEEKNICGIIGLLVVMVVCIMEPRLMQLELNPFLLFLNYYVVKENPSPRLLVKRICKS